MPRMTKTQQKNAYKAILSKARRLHFITSGPLGMSITDYIAIEKICKKYLKKV